MKGQWWMRKEKRENAEWFGSREEETASNDRHYIWLVCACLQQVTTLTLFHCASAIE